MILIAILAVLAVFFLLAFLRGEGDFYGSNKHKFHNKHYSQGSDHF